MRERKKKKAVAKKEESESDEGTSSEELSEDADNAAPKEVWDMGTGGSNGIHPRIQTTENGASPAEITEGSDIVKGSSLLDHSNDDQITAADNGLLDAERVSNG
ncbi:unnamed protein product [Toxocara canis]|uniref:CHZ domain-containing protein n=1 Tax=Toxocara canis TaxID=6265 RepID=A0A183V4W8_TOXCA|nr:unnamed protein product [Toxocara canis]